MKIKSSPKKSISELKKLLDKKFSEYIRRSYADDKGCVSCYTCGKYMSWRESHAGHFMSRQYLNTRYSEKNVRPQCPGCNIFGGGKQAAFGMFLEREYGDEILSELYREANKIVKDFPYEKWIKYYEDKLKELSTT